MTQRGVSVALVLFVAAIVNFPVAHNTYLQWQLERSGEDVVAQVTEAREVGNDFIVVVTIPATNARAEFVGGVARVDEITFIDRGASTDTSPAQAASGHIPARALPDREGVFEVRGQQRSRVGLIATLIADLFLIAIVGLRWRFGARPFDEDEDSPNPM